MLQCHSMYVILYGTKYFFFKLKLQLFKKLEMSNYLMAEKNMETVNVLVLPSDFVDESYGH